MISLLDEIFTDFSNWFLSQQRILPWRSEPTLYRVWISEIMLQQTQVKTVIPYFEKFIARFPDVEALANASLDEVLLYWAGLGYYSRARNIHKAAVLIHEKGHFPNNKEEWLELPGIGNYTAGAILSIAMNFPEAILDGNVERILCRIRAIKNPKNEKKRLWKLSEKLVQTAFEKNIKPSVFNQAMMELGATYCSPKKPNCGLCAFSRICKARKTNSMESYPAKRKTSWEKVTEKVYCIKDKNNNVLIEKQGEASWRAGLYDFPEKIPKFIASASIIFSEEITTSHVVTNHKITRKTELLDYQGFFEDNNHGKWFYLNLFSENIPVAVGSAFKKTLQKIREVKEREERTLF